MVFAEELTSSFMAVTYATKTGLAGIVLPLAAVSSSVSGKFPSRFGPYKAILKLARFFFKNEQRKRNEPAELKVGEELTKKEAVAGLLILFDCLFTIRDKLLVIVKENCRRMFHIRAFTLVLIVDVAQK